MKTSITTIRSHFKRVDPVIYAVMENMDFDTWQSPLQNPDQYFQRLCEEIITQQLSVKVARVIRDRFIALFPSEQVTAFELLKLSDQQLRDVGMSWAKARYVKDLAQKTVDGLIDYQNIPLMTDDEVAAQLIQVKGIGQWTVDMFLMFNLGREDHFSYGDLGLKRGLKQLYGFAEYPTLEETEAIITTWLPYKSYGCFALWESLDNV